MTETPVVAYFSMEVGLASAMPTYAGGLGVLASTGRGHRGVSGQLRYGPGQAALCRRGCLAQHPAAAPRGVGHQRHESGVNGVPSLSVLDGWWIEGCVEGVTGWAIGEQIDTSLLTPQEMEVRHAAALYEKLAQQVLPCFYHRREHFIAMMRHAIMRNGAFFNTQRMVWQYLHNAYRVHQAGARDA